MKNLVQYLTVLSLFTLIATTSLAQTSPKQKDKKIQADLLINTGLLYWSIADSVKEARYHLTIKADVNFNEVIKINGMLQTGDVRGVTFNNLYDFEAGEFNFDPQIHLKRFYLERESKNKKTNIKLGGFGPRKTISITNRYADQEWFDGLRVSSNTKIGYISGTIGYIDFDEPRFFKRVQNFDVNYFEFAITKDLLKNVLAELGVEFYEGETFVNAITKYDLQLAVNKILHLNLEARADVKFGAVKISFGLKDILSLSNNKKLQDIKLDMNYEHNPLFDNPLLSGLVDNIHQGYTGSVIVTHLNYPISKRNGFYGFTNLRFGDDISKFRFETGVKKRVLDTKKKRKNKEEKLF